MERTITYFEKLGPENTEVTFKLARERARELGIKRIVLASTTGATARKAMEYFQSDGVQLVVVPHQWDFHRDVNRFPDELVKELRDTGHAVHFGTMLFHTGELYDSGTPQAMANVLRTVCGGLKVCVEIVLMATDAGLVKSGERIVAVAGTARGADTALVMQAASSQHLKHLRVNEILCKPLHPLNTDETYALLKPDQETGA